MVYKVHTSYRHLVETLGEPLFKDTWADYTPGEKVTVEWRFELSDRSEIEIYDYKQSPLYSMPTRVNDELTEATFNWLMECYWATATVWHMQVRRTGPGSNVPGILAKLGSLLNVQIY